MKWDRPKPVSEATLAFPACVVKELMPTRDEIPPEFWLGHTLWNQLVSDWFYRGIKNLTLTAKEGVDRTEALRHVTAILRSFEPQHEHKEAACAYLLSLWFESGATWD